MESVEFEDVTELCSGMETTINNGNEFLYYDAHSNELRWSETEMTVFSLSIPENDEDRI